MVPMGKKQPAKLIFASSENADMLYATGFRASDPLIFLEDGGESILVMNDLEYNRAKAESKVDTVLRTKFYKDQLKESGKEVSLENVINLVLKERDIKELAVPNTFPTGLYLQLVGKQYSVKTTKESFFPQREIKTEEELRAIEQAQSVNEEALEKALDMIRGASIKDGVLHLGGEVLTSERVMTELLHFYLERGYSCPHDMIVACGPHSAIPHHDGEGPLYANQPIIIDLFPRSIETGYWADMTRTVVKGRAPERLKRMYQAVLASQEAALSMIKEGVLGTEVHDKVISVLEEYGFPLEDIGGTPQGMIHGTGHGLGLDIHEKPSLSESPWGDNVLIAGQVVTVEPGLYYEGFGGVRIEDFVVVQKNGCKNLTKAKKFLEIP